MEAERKPPAEPAKMKEKKVCIIYSYKLSYKKGKCIFIRVCRIILVLIMLSQEMELVRPVYL